MDKYVKSLDYIKKYLLTKKGFLSILEVAPTI